MIYYTDEGQRVTKDEIRRAWETQSIVLVHRRGMTTGLSIGKKWIPNQGTSRDDVWTSAPSSLLQCYGIARVGVRARQ